MDQCEIPTCELPGWTAGGRPVWAKWYYRADSPIRSLHRSLKYEGRAAIGRLLGNHRVHFDGVDGWCVPIPSHRTKILERGFLHTVPIAAAFASANQLQLHLGAFIRPSLSPSQSGLTREFRTSNVQGAFSVTKSIEGKHVLLVDDVMTTGATLDSASEVLEKAGATVTLAVVAFRRESFKRP
ncbi:MAG: phosphoribosyltransferase family protein [Bacteroidetes bacterium]|nr:phosphoribosyltransferase family protein [Bacteroidota bacterium]